MRKNTWADDVRITHSVCAVIEDYLSEIRQYMPDTLDGFYLHGSIALGAFIEHASDIDFVAVVKRELTQVDLDALASIHASIAARHPFPVMEGNYIRWSDLGKEEVTAQPYPYFASSVMHASGFFNHNPVTWWTLSRRGICVLGPEIGSLGMEADEDALVAYVQENMHGYWKQRLQALRRTAAESNWSWSIDRIEEEMEWSVLGMLRQYYTLSERSVVSKIGAGQYALTHLPPHWHPVIREALRIRMKESRLQSDAARKAMLNAMNLMQYILEAHTPHEIHTPQTDP